MFRYVVTVLTVLISIGTPGMQRLIQSAAVPVLGTWFYMGTIPSGFVRTGSNAGRITLTTRHDRLDVSVVTGRHRYATTGQYDASRRELRFVVYTRTGAVRLDATVAQGNTRMIGTWYDAHGDDGGFVLRRTGPRTN